MIDKAKLGSIIDSTYGYINTINNFYVTSLADNQEFELNKTYFINNGQLEDYDIFFSGTKPKEGIITYYNNDFVNGILEIEDYIILIKTDNIKVYHNENDRLYKTEDKGRYIYRGSNPDNYIWLDENGDNVKKDSELYRIISFENDGTIKVVRNNSIGEFVWDEPTERKNENNTYCVEMLGCHVWGNSNNTLYKDNSLGNYFFYEFYTSNDGTTNWLGKGTINDNSTLNEFLNKDWLGDHTSLDKYIDNHKFNVGAYKNANITKQMEINEIKSYTWQGKIALINLLEYTETSTSKYCLQVFHSYINQCSEENWLNRKIEEHTITPGYNRHRIWDVTKKGQTTISYASDKKNVRPSFYIKNNFSLKGNGTKQSPFYLSEN